MSTYSDYDEGDWDVEREVYRRGKKFHKPMGAGFPHIPNKAERKELARIMQASGMTEEEVREDLTHRRALAAASKSMSKSPHGWADRLRLNQKRDARRIAHRENIPIWEAQKKAGLT
jgi:DNA-binding transcriptional regulator PaaX